MSRQHSISTATRSHQSHQTVGWKSDLNHLLSALPPMYPPKYPPPKKMTSSLKSKAVFVYVYQTPRGEKDRTINLSRAGTLCDILLH